MTNKGQDASSPWRARRGWRAGGIAVVLLLVGALVWGETRPQDPAPRGLSPEGGAVTFAAVGDSLTEARSADFANGDIGSDSWVWHAATDGLGFAGGWAVWGAPTSMMAANVQPVDADVLVVLAGTNDVSLGVPFEQTAANIAAVVAVAGPERVLVSAVPPVDRAAGFEAPTYTHSDYNALLEEFVRDRGWEWTDAAAGLRDGGRFLPGMSYDGVHLTEAGAKVMGEAILGE